MNGRARWLSPRVVVGVFIILLGLVLTLDNAGVPVATALRDLLANGWPVVFILAGVARLLEAPAAYREPSPYVWLAVGVALLAHNFGYVDLEQLWPLALVAGGVFLVWRAYVPPAAPQPDTGERIDAFSLMGAARRTSASAAFLGGNVTAVMGGVEMDLRGATLAPGGAAVEAFTLWGGIEIIVPRGWRVTSRGVALLGGFDDKTNPPDDGAADGPVLVISGAAVMGGVEIKH